MKANQAVSAGKTGIGRKRLVGALLTFALIAVAMAAYGGFVSARGSTGSTSSTTFTCPSNADCAALFDNVQVAIQTTEGSTSYQYAVSVYNTTGGLVASYQSQYAAAAFELPQGTYTIAVTADQQGQYFYPLGVTSSGASGVPAPTTSGSSTAIICCYPGTPAQSVKTLPPCCGGSPAIEYGYLSQQVSGPTSVTITTKPINETSVSTLTLHVNYPNGTAASGVYLYGSVLGDSYGWAYGTSTVSLSNTTDSRGTATLTVPDAPILVSADASIPITLPLNQTTVQVTVAGVKVNVTAYWQPSYVSFTAQALILPPQNSATLTLQYQPQSYGPVPLGATTETATAVATPQLVTGQSGQTSQTAPASAGNAEAPATGSTGQTSTGSDGLFISIAAVAIAAVALGVALFVTRAHAATTAK